MPFEAIAQACGAGGFFRPVSIIRLMAERSSQYRFLQVSVARSDEQAKAQPHGGDLAALERWRDENIVAILKARADPVGQ